MPLDDEPMFTFTVVTFSPSLSIFLFSQTHLWYLGLIKLLKFAMLSFYFYLRKQTFSSPCLSPPLPSSLTFPLPTLPLLFSLLCFPPGSCILFLYLAFKWCSKCSSLCQNSSTQIFSRKLVKHKSFQVNYRFIA